MLNMGRVVEVPVGCGGPEACAAVGLLVERHDSLRMTYRLDGEEQPFQRMAGEGELTLEVVEAGERDPGVVSDEVVNRLTASPYRSDELPLRAALVCRAGVPSRLVLSVFHMAADNHGMRILTDDLERILAAGGDKAKIVALSEAGITQLSERIRFETGPEGEKASRRALRYWERELEKFPADMLPLPAGEPERPRIREIFMASPAVSVASRMLAEHHRVTSWSILLASLATLHCRRVGIDRFGFLLFSHNRFGGRFGQVSGTVTQSAPVCVEVGDSELPDVARRAWRSAMFASTFGQWDPYGLARLLDETATGERRTVDLSCSINLQEVGERPSAESISMDATRLDRMREQTRFGVVRSLEHETMRLYLTIREKSDRTELLLRTDTRHLSSADARAFLAELEEGLVTAVREIKTASTP
jgi:hypothetical protein